MIKRWFTKTQTTQCKHAGPYKKETPEPMPTTEQCWDAWWSAAEAGEFDQEQS